MTCLPNLGLGGLALAISLALPALANAQESGIKERLVGAWALVSLTADAQGRTIQPFSPNPIGRMILDPDGNFATVILRPGLPQLASNNRMQGTPDEYKAIVQGSNAFFGTYSVNEAENVLIFKVEFATFPNWNGDEQRRVLTLEDEELRYTNSNTTVGGGTSQVVWRRVN